MQYLIDVDQETGLGHITISGDIGMEGLRELLVQAWEHPVYSTIDRATWNFLDANTALSLDDLFELTQWILENKKDQGAKVIAFVASDDLMFGMSRMFHAIQNDFGWMFGVFRTEQEAHAWLEQQEPAIRDPGVG